MNPLIKILCCILALPFILLALTIILPLLLILLILFIFMPTFRVYCHHQNYHNMFRKKDQQTEPEPKDDVCDIEYTVLESKVMDDHENSADDHQLKGGN